MIYIGIDVHKKICTACVQDTTGKILNEFTFENKNSGFQQVLYHVQQKKAQAVIESTGNLWIRLYTTLEAAGIKVVLANPTKIRMIAESAIKTDKVDARTLADLLRADLIPSCYVPSLEVRALRALVRYRTKLVKASTRIKNRIHSHLDKYELPPCECTDKFGKGGLQWLEMILSFLDLEDQFIVEMELDRLKELQDRITTVEQKIAVQALAAETAFCEAVREDITLLLTLIGVDFFTAALFLSEIGDISRFSSPSKLTSWLGLVPSVHQSGDTYYHGKITKKGTPLVRWALIQAAQSAVRWDPHWAEKFERIKSRRGKQKAYVAIARSLAVTMYCMLTKREPYRYGREKTFTRKLKSMYRLLRKANPKQGEALVCFSS